MTAIEWTRTEEKLAQRGRDAHRPYRQIAETINRTLYEGLTVRTGDDVREHLRYTSRPRPVHCRMLFQSGLSTAQIASRLGWFESDIYNALARHTKTVAP